MARNNLEVVRKLIEAVQRDDLQAAVSLLDPELEWIPLRAATEGAYYGHAGFEKFAADTNETFEIFEPHFELHDIGGERVLAWGTITVRGKGSGIELDIPVGGIFSFRGGKITRWHDFGSKEEALAALERQK